MHADMKVIRPNPPHAPFPMENSMWANSLSGAGLDNSQPSELQKWGHPTRQEAWALQPSPRERSQWPNSPAGRSRGPAQEVRGRGAQPETGRHGDSTAAPSKIGEGAAAMEKREQGQVDTLAFTPPLG